MVMESGLLVRLQVLRHKEVDLQLQFLTSLPISLVHMACVHRRYSCDSFVLCDQPRGGWLRISVKTQELTHRSRELTQ